MPAPEDPTDNPTKPAAQLLKILGGLDWFPIRKTLARYNGEKFSGDIRAGINVALLAFPQGMAYALIAGLPIQYGIYGSAIATLIGCLFAKSHFITLGPTNATSVLLALTFGGLALTDEEKLVYLPTLVAMVGIVLVIGALLRVASLIQFISRTVVTGYITAAAAYIIGNQIRTALGFSFGPDQKPKSFIDVVHYTAINLPNTHMPTLALSAIAFVLVFLLRRYFRALSNVAITLVVMSLVALGFKQGGLELVYLEGIDASQWPVSFPSFNYDIVVGMFSAALTIALLAVLEGTSIGKSLAAKAGSRVDTSQEMFSMGMSNIGCSIFSGMPASGSLTRSVLNIESGARTPLGAWYSGAIVAVGAFLLGQYIGYIPRAALAVVVVFIGISLINLDHIKMVMKSRKEDAIVFLVTVIIGLVIKLDLAIYLGSAVSIGLFLRQVARPEFSEYAFSDSGELKELRDEGRPMPEISIVHVEGDIFFGAAELFRDQMRRISEDPNLKIIILKTRNARNLDASAMMALHELITVMNEAGRYLVVCEATQEIARLLRNSGVIDLLEERNLIMDDVENPTLSAAMALKRAQEQLGEWAKDAKVSVYVGEKEFTV
ncbi:MAG: SulP family inorganic anion transporter [Opitutales bacterium]|nr:SulP family inorganic anion transporter [Opitutales bacterium]